MRFGPSEAALALRDAVAGTLAAEVSPATIRAGWPGGDQRVVAEAWRKLAATGVTGALVPAAAGGLGLDEACLVPALEEIGRSGLPGPVAETIAVAAPALAAGSGSGPLDRILSGEATVAVQLAGGALVPHAQTADFVVLRQADALWLHDRQALALRPCSTVDGSRGVARLPPPPEVAAGRPPAAPTGTLLTDDQAAVQLAWLRGVTATAALLNGLSLRMLDMTVGYVRQREQFGVPVGSFQAIKHALANALVAVEFARPAAHAAAWALAAAQPDADARASMAKVLAADAAGLVARTAIQCHGAIGYTTEYDLHLWAKRAWALIADWGTTPWHRAQLAHHLGV
ncbi:MAG TPA: acyl-CoA dehydrogenase family protein [Trebonia sp.]|nr:acyl-CoA dehydrogenase family protein [Trebonia sp.]